MCVECFIAAATCSFSPFIQSILKSSRISLSAKSVKDMINRVRPRLVTFDVTGTLLMTKLEQHYSEIGSQHGLFVEPKKLAQSFKSNFTQLSKEHPIYGKHTGLGWENWWRTIVHNVFRDQHASVSKNQLDKVADSLIECYGTSRCWHKYPGAIDLLDYLRKRDIILGVISNFDVQLESVLKDTQIHQYFTFVLTSYDFGVEKPSLPIFKEALRLVKHLREEEISPQEAIHIGDRLDNDYFGAKNAGWNALLIKHEDEIDESKIPKEDIFGSLKELQEHFRMIFGTNYIAGYGDVTSRRSEQKRQDGEERLACERRAVTRRWSTAK